MDRVQSSTWSGRGQVAAMSETFSATRGRALLLFPLSFYSFGSVLEKALTETGYAVTLANDEYPANVFGKIFGKLGLFGLLSGLTAREILRRYPCDGRYDLVVIVKGRGMGRSLLDGMRAAKSRIVAYNFDSFAYNPSPRRWYRYADKFCTFDYVDADRHSLPVVELFSSLPIDDEPKRIVYNLSAILRNHSNRLKYLDDVLKLLPDGKSFIYIFEQNPVYFLFNFLRNPLLYAKYWKHIHFKALPYQDYVAVLKNSDFTLDYAHPKQSGITVRCFEALSAQTKIITNNGFVKRNPFFDDRNTIVFNQDTGPGGVSASYRKLKGSSVPKHHRTVSDFMGDLLA
jgi:hypothetical protein